MTANLAHVFAVIRKTLFKIQVYSNISGAAKYYLYLLLNPRAFSTIHTVYVC